MTKSEFIKIIEERDDIMFSCNDHKFVIFNWCDEGICIGVQSSDPMKNNPMYFSYTNDLINNYFVDDKPLADSINKIVIQQCS